MRVVESFDVMRTRSPIAVVGAEVVVIRAIAVAVSIKQGSLVHPPRRIETPAKRTVEDAIPRDKRIRAKPGIPIPVCTPPPRSPRSRPVLGINACRIDIGLRQVSRTQTAPTIEVTLLVLLLVELLRLKLPVDSKADLMIALD